MPDTTLIEPNNKYGPIAEFLFTSVIITPDVFDLFEVRHSLRFLLKALLIGIIELSKGITNPSMIARKVALAVGIILKFTLGELLNK